MPLRDAIVFAVFDCGFQPRSALEENDSGDVRFDKIRRLIENSRFGIHDISRTEADPDTGLPRFNMPLELGVFLGARRFGDATQRKKVCLILDIESFRYQAFISDIAGCDIKSHGGDPDLAIANVRNWLNASSGRRTIPGGAAISRRYQEFLDQLPQICEEAELRREELTYNDFCTFASEWLMANKNA